MSPTISFVELEREFRKHKTTAFSGPLVKFKFFTRHSPDNAGLSEDTAGRASTPQLRTRKLFLIVIAAICLYVLLDAIAQLLPPHYSPIRDAESDLAVGPYGYIMAINFLNRGILSIVFLLALSRTAQMTKREESTRMRGALGIGEYVFGVWAVGAILLAIFPTDVPATPVSWHGAIHLVVAAGAFFGGAFGALLLSLRFSSSQVLQKVRKPTLSIAILSVLLLLVASVSLTSRVGGLTERMFLGSVLLWQAVVSANLAQTLSKQVEVRT